MWEGPKDSLVTGLERWEEDMGEREGRNREGLSLEVGGWSEGGGKQGISTGVAMKQLHVICLFQSVF